MLEATVVTGDRGVHYAAITWGFSRAVAINDNEIYTAGISGDDLKVYFTEYILRGCSKLFVIV